MRCGSKEPGSRCIRGCMELIDDLCVESVSRVWRRSETVESCVDAETQGHPGASGFEGYLRTFENELTEHDSGCMRRMARRSQRSGIHEQ